MAVQIPGRQVAPQSQIPSVSRAAPSDAFGAPIAEALAGVGQDASRLGEAFAQHAVVMQGLQNKADSDTAYVGFVEAGNGLRTKYLEDERGGNALPKLPQYMKDMEDLRGKFAENLNPMAKRLYESDSRRLYAGFQSEMSRHAAQENRSYTVASSSARMDTAANLAVQNAGDPMYLAAAKEAITKESGFQSEYLGLGPDVAKNTLDKRMSGLYVGVLKQLANDDPPTASAYFEAHKSEMVGSDIEAMDGYLKRTMQPYIATQVADSIANGHTSVASTPAIAANPQAFFSRIAGGEVGINSAARTPEHNAAVGGVPNSYHIPANGTAYDLKPPPGMTTAQLAAKLKQSNLGASEIIDEKNHVHVGWAKTASQQISTDDSIRGATTIEDLESRRAAGLAAVDRAIDQHYGGDPVLKAAAETRFDGIYGRKYAALKATQDGARDRVVGALVDAEAPPKDLDSFFASYNGAKQDYLTMSPVQQKAVQTQLRNNANPQVKDLSLAQRQTWAYLDGEQRTNPAAFANRDLLQDPETNGLPFSMLQSMIKKQNEIKAGKGLDPSEGRMLAWAQPFLKEAQIEKTDPEYNKFMSALFANAKAYYDINKQYPDEKWTREQTQSLLVQRSTGFLQKNYSFAVPEYSGLVPGVPNSFAASIIAQARAKGINLNNEQIGQLYKRKVGNGGR